MDELSTRAFWVTAPGRGEIRDCRLPERRPEDVLVRTLYSGVSRGTESLVFQGRVPASQYQAMRAPFQEGDFPAPVKYGYSNVGIVEEGPDSLRGRTVFCFFPHQTRYLAPATSVVPLPPAIPAGRAVLAANLETAVNGVWDAAPGPGDRITVVGGGTVGFLAAWLCRGLAGVSLELVDVDPSKKTVAEALRIPFQRPKDATPESDVVIHCSGAPEGLAAALRLAGREAVVVEMSWFGDRIVDLPLGEDFHSRRLTIRSSQVGSVPSSRQPRWTRRRRLELALKLLADDQLDLLISGESAFDELPETLARLSAGPEGTLCHRIVYE